MRGGPLRHRVELQEQVETRTPSGAVVVAWQTFKSVRASIEPMSGRERYSGDQIRAEATTLIRVRFASDVWPRLTPKCRVMHQGVIYNIAEVSPDLAKQQWVRVMATSGVNRG
jgi:SPP1 family predicted phage head-tail adaptor